MRQTMVGMPFISRVTALAESTIYNYTPGGHMLTICVSNPARGLIHSVQNEEVVFGLFEIERTLFILAKFGRLPWQASYSTGGSTLRCCGLIRGMTWAVSKTVSQLVCAS